MHSRMNSCRRAAGFSLIELLVVLLVIALLLAIVVPGLIASIPERNLAAAGDKFANDVNYARAKAEASGNNVFLAFVTEPDVRQVQYATDWTNTPPDVVTANTPGDGQSFNVPPNSGVSRVARRYYIVEERPRSRADGSPYTYLDWLNDYDEWVGGNGNYPVEPMFPFDALKTASLGVLPDPGLGPFNRVAAPIAFNPLDLSQVSSGGSYEDVHIAFRPLNGGDWLTGNALDQARKNFCIADEQEILAYDQNTDGAGAGGELRSYDPVPGGQDPLNPFPGSHGDHPRLLDQVTDYVLLKLVELPDHVFFMNPWKDEWCIGWEDIGNDRLYEVRNMQFLQYLWQFGSDGEVSLAKWTFDPETFPDGSTAGIVHGTVDVVDDIPLVRPMWMVIDECVDFGSNVNTYAGFGFGATANLVDNRKSNQQASGRMFTLWTLNGKYYVDDYTPNDGAKAISYDDPRLNLDIRVNAGGDVALTDLRAEMEYSALVAREYGYNQNFLVPVAEN